MENNHINIGGRITQEVLNTIPIGTNHIIFESNSNLLLPELNLINYKNLKKITFKYMWNYNIKGFNYLILPISIETINLLDRESQNKFIIKNFTMLKNIKEITLNYVHKDFFNNKFPENIEKLKISHINIETFPHPFPKKLKNLTLSLNKLTNLSYPLPKQLEKLKIRCEKLTDISTLPHNLWSLEISNSDTKLTKLCTESGDMPEFLEHCEICANFDHLCNTIEFGSQLETLYIGTFKLPEIKFKPRSEQNPIKKVEIGRKWGYNQPSYTNQDDVKKFFETFKDIKINKMTFNIFSITDINVSDCDFSNIKNLTIYLKTHRRKEINFKFNILNYPDNLHIKLPRVNSSRIGFDINNIPEDFDKSIKIYNITLNSFSKLSKDLIKYLSHTGYYTINEIKSYNQGIFINLIKKLTAPE